MLFADVDLAARIERADCALLTESAAAAARRGVDVFVHDLAGGVAVHAGPGSPLDKLVGLGFAGALEEAELLEVEHAFAERDTPVQAEVASLADPAVAALLSRRGYVLENFENVLGRALPGEPLRAPAGIEVTLGGETDLERWLDAVVTGFASPDAEGVPSHQSFPREALEPVMRDMTAVRGFRRYLAWRDGVLAGGASLRLADGIAQLCGAATLPEHRRCGVQTALLAARLEHAAREGCELAVVTTQPGSRSQLNVQRRGFELLYTRAVLVQPRR